MEDDDHQCEEGAPPWMATFSDMATLLLTFFVLLLSFATMDVQHFREALGSVQEAFGVQFKVYGSVEAMSTSPVELSDHQSASQIRPSGESTEEAVRKLKRYMSDKGLAGQVTVSSSSRGISLQMGEVVLFDSGSDEILASGHAALDAVAEVFGGFDGELAVEGHTDDVPIGNSRFRSNWELSTARATAVLRYFAYEKHLDPERMHVAGYADMKPLVENTDATRRAQNRRVEFIFETTPLQKGEESPIIEEPIFRLPFTAGQGSRSLKK